MGCTPPVKTVTLAIRTVVYSKGGSPNDSEVFVLSPDSLMQIAPMLEKVRGTLRVENATANFQGQMVFQTTSDGESWDSPQNIGSAQSVGGSEKELYYTSDWTSIANTKRGIRFGVTAAGINASSNPEFARVSVILDLMMYA